MAMSALYQPRSRSNWAQRSCAGAEELYALTRGLPLRGFNEGEESPGAVHRRLPINESFIVSMTIEHLKTCAVGARMRCSAEVGLEAVRLVLKELACEALDAPRSLHA
jgi:hypothetical protein